MNQIRRVLPHLRAWRQSLILTQAELSLATGLAESTISNLENGGLAYTSTIAKLSQALGITRHQLVYEQPPIDTWDAPRRQLPSMLDARVQQAVTLSGGGPYRGKAEE